MQVDDEEEFFLLLKGGGDVVNEPVEWKLNDFYPTEPSLLF